YPARSFRPVVGTAARAFFEWNSNDTDNQYSPPIAHCSPSSEILQILQSSENLRTHNLSHHRGVAVATAKRCGIASGKDPSRAYRDYHCWLGSLNRRHARHRPCYLWPARDYGFPHRRGRGHRTGIARRNVVTFRRRARPASPSTSCTSPLRSCPAVYHLVRHRRAAEG